MQPFPASTVFGRTIPKTKFYDRMSVSASVKHAFVSEVETIVWKNKLSATTLNVQPGERVCEIDVFEMSLKQPRVSDALLHAIDHGVPHLLLFLLRHEELWQAAIGYKEIGKSAITLAVKEYYRTTWQPLDHLPLAISGMTLDEVFDNFVRQIHTALPEASTQSLRTDLETQARHEVLQRKIDALKRKMLAEKQPHRSFELFQQIRELQAHLQG